LTAALTGRRPTVYSDGEQSRDFTSIDNVVEANLLACWAGPAALGDVFKVVAGSRTTVHEQSLLVRTLAWYRSAAAG
jgi:nucleoside-diphosphate-sugar epimerase